MPLEVPHHVKERLRTVLQSRMGGMLMDHVCDDYQRLMNHPLPFRELGYRSLETFLRSLPDVARLEYVVGERRMKVHGVAKFSFCMGLRHQNGQVFPLMTPQPRKLEVRNVKSGFGATNQWPSSTADGNPYNVKPDQRGVYTVCFPSWQKPEEHFGTLEEMFGVAGKVFEVYETQRWIYVCYTDYRSVQRAFKMFSHLELKTATEEALRMAKTQKVAEKRKLDFSQHPNMPGSQCSSGIPRKRKKVLTGGCQRVFVGNLNPSVKYTFDMFRKLFHDYTIIWISLKSVQIDGPSPKTFAYVLATNIKDAERMVKEFNDYVWFGRPLVLAIKEKRKATKPTANQNNTDISRDVSFGSEVSCDSVEDMPGLEPAMPGLEPAMPGLEPAMPGLEPAMPGLESVLPPLEPAMPGLEPILPPLEPAMPGLEPIPPSLELEAVGPLDNLQVQRIFEIPTVLVTNIRPDVEEVALRSLFAVYRPSIIRMTCSQLGQKKAFIELGSVDDVRQAVNNLNHSLFQGLRLKVDVPFNKPQLRKTLGLDNGHDPAIGAITLSKVLKMRGSMMQVLQASDFPFLLGQKVEVLVTAVISDKFFWGQVTHPGMAKELQMVSDSLNAVPFKELHRASGPGRCKARFHGDGKWYRAWVMHNSQQNGQHCRVFYLDYGNTDHIPWSHTAKVPERWLWNLPPLAIPFTLIEAVPNLKERELTHMTLEVNALGSLEEGNMVVVRVVSLVPSATVAASGFVRTIIM